MPIFLMNEHEQKNLFNTSIISSCSVTVNKQTRTCLYSCSFGSFTGLFMTKYISLKFMTKYISLK
ncbi:hypothetical protein Hanom_Chr16g01516671 [Helianthus anomalus]